jgi:hypothetical protein
LSIIARSTTQIRQRCPICGADRDLDIATLRRGVDLSAMGASGLDPDVLRLPACGACTNFESLRLDTASWNPARKASLAGRRRAAALWLVRKLAKDDLWTSAGLKALRAGETDPPDVAADPAGATLEPV